MENLIHLVLVISFVCHLVNYQKPHRVQLTQRQHHMCSNVGVWVMTLGQTPHHRPPDTHSSLGEITASMLAKLHIHLPPWAKMKALRISTCAKTRRNMKQQQHVVHAKSSKKKAGVGEMCVATVYAFVVRCFMRNVVKKLLIWVENWQCHCLHVILKRQHGHLSVWKLFGFA